MQSPQSSMLKKDALQELRLPHRIMPEKMRNLSSVALPNGWSRSVRSIMLQVISLAKYALVHTRGWAADSANDRVRLRAENERLWQEVALLREELRIKDARMVQIAAHHRPFYAPTERMAILELKAARGWNARQAADAFLITAATITSWTRRIDEEGPHALVQLAEPVNRFPDFARHVVQRLKALCPALGKVKIAESLARAGMHLAPATVGRMLREPPPKPPAKAERDSMSPVVTAKRPNHVWHVDLTTLPTSGGFWTAWCPGALPQCWPFCWWIAVVVDHFSRRVMGVGVFRKQPSSRDVRALLGRTISQAGTPPRHLICDKGPQFWCDGFKAWCRRRGIRPRYGAIGQHGSIAVIERFLLTMKTEGLQGLLIHFRYDAFRRALLSFIGWYNSHRPHTTLHGSTPDEVYHALSPANQQPRYEPRERWPRGSPCAKPAAPIRGDPGAKLELHVEFVGGDRRLSVITLKPAA